VPIIRRVVGQVINDAAVRIHDVDVLITLLVGHECDLAVIQRPAGHDVIRRMVIDLLGSEVEMNSKPVSSAYLTKTNVGGYASLIGDRC